MDYDEVAEHMSKLDAALAEVDALRHKLADAETKYNLCDEMRRNANAEIERLTTELDNRIREVIAANRRTEAAETALSELRQKLEWWDG